MEDTKTPEEIKKDEKNARRREADAKRREEANAKANEKVKADAKETPPVETPPVETPPVETPPVVKPPVETPPVTKPPVVPAKIETKEEKAKAIEDAKVKENTEKVTLFNLLGKEVPKNDYFFKGIVPPGFEGTCGKAVDREDLITAFHKVFKEKDNILFYKQLDKEVYIVIVPIKYSNSIGEFNDSIEGDFQKHAISFLSEGSVNLDTMKIKLEKVKTHVKYDDR